ncbi:hypothetical protein [Fibrobacter sp. UWH4]|uniref:hypothetical protein n=1 Tax=Fibrobacter sp. UWH4 TaxID=1896210 RepID=UPI00090F06B7|nr:hypothetical protein [Fibrobacter sp. UWH4]SHL03785.1 hypothetical protein SAMN05720762_10432 [Fibrobacter sp. UWH4]
MMTKTEELVEKFKALEDLAKKKILVGWIDGNNTARIAYENLQSRKKTGKATPAIKAPASNALIARTLNYGRQEGTTAEGRHYPEIVARPFMKYAEENFRKIYKRILARNVPLVLAGKMDVDTLANAIGTFYRDEVTRAIRDSSKYPAVSEKTLKARRRHGSTSAVPLIDTHQLVDSVSFEVR